MLSPFLGMDPYLEDKEIWRGFHHHLAEDIITQLNEVMNDRYYAEVEIGVSTSPVVFPDAAVLEVATPTTIAVRAAEVVGIATAPIQRMAMLPEKTKLRAVHIYASENKELVTTIEILSPTNKHSDGLETYRRKRQRLLRSQVHFMELDLLRAGERPGWDSGQPARRHRLYPFIESRSYRKGSYL